MRLNLNFFYVTKTCFSYNYIIAAVFKKYVKTYVLEECDKHWELKKSFTNSNSVRLRHTCKQKVI